MDAELLFEYGNYMKGEKVVTVITVADSSEGLLKANTENNDSSCSSRFPDTII